MINIQTATAAYAENPSIENLQALNAATSFVLAQNQLDIPARKQKQKQKKDTDYLKGNKFALQLSDTCYATIYAGKQLKDWSQPMLALLLGVSRVHIARIQTNQFVHASNLLEKPEFQAEIEKQMERLNAVPEATKRMLKQKGTELYWRKKG